MEEMCKKKDQEEEQDCSRMHIGGVGGGIVFRGAGSRLFGGSGFVRLRRQGGQEKKKIRLTTVCIWNKKLRGGRE